MNSKKCPKAIIFVAMESERTEIVTPALKELGLAGSEDVWVVVTGVGKVRAALITTKTLFVLQLMYGDEAKKCTCINVGVCGGSELAYKNHKAVEIGTVVNNDFDTSAVTPDFKKEVIHLKPELDDGFKWFTCLTQDHFCVDKSELPDENMWYVDMELFGIASACKSAGMKLKAIKSITDVIGADKQDKEYQANFEDACKRAVELLKGSLKITL